MATKLGKEIGGQFALSLKNQSHVSSFSIVDESNNPVSLNEEILSTQIETLQGFDWAVLASTKKPIGQYAVNASSYRYGIVQFVGSEDVVFGTPAKKEKVKLREVNLYIRQKTQTIGNLIAPLDAGRYGAGDITSDISQNHNIQSTDEVDLYMYALAEAGMLPENILALSTDDTEAIDGEELRAAVKTLFLKFIALRNNEVKRRNKQDIVVSITDLGYSAYIDVPMKLGAGSDKQFTAFETGRMADDMIDGVKFMITNKMPEGTIAMPIVIGEFGAVLADAYIRPFIDIPAGEGGALQVYNRQDYDGVVARDYYLGKVVYATAPLSVEALENKSSVLEAETNNLDQRKIAIKMLTGKAETIKAEEAKNKIGKFAFVKGLTPAEQTELVAKAVGEALGIKLEEMMKIIKPKTK